ncbi:unnamed protein product [Protopolystoma xenopodis]|uniref:Uncharacterized protein n=1 Tax=Protopolystoma xenopodis TaxID=117903 RepID=A0A3S5C2N4_9PLAT|nr:unnamed protein product [Protopolystoma xenopodis]
MKLGPKEMARVLEMIDTETSARRLHESEDVPSSRIETPTSAPVDQETSSSPSDKCQNNDSSSGLEPEAKVSPGTSVSSGVLGTNHSHGNVKERPQPSQ